MRTGTLFRPTTIAALAAATVASYVWFDLPLAKLAHGRPEVVEHSLQWITRFGYSLWYLVGSFAAYWLCRLILKQRRRLRSGLLLAFCSIAGAGILVNVIKFAVGRSRPVRFFDHGDTAFHFFTSSYATNSFPSGHASTAFALTATLALMFPRARWYWLALGAVIALSRVGLNHHYLSDVIIGGYLAIAVTVWLHEVMVSRQGASVVLFPVERVAPARSPHVATGSRTDAPAAADRGVA